MDDGDTPRHVHHLEWLRQLYSSGDTMTNPKREVLGWAYFPLSIALLPWEAHVVFLIQEASLCFFQRAHIDVDVAINGQECLDNMIEKTKCTLILMDVLMPVMDGLEAVQHFRLLSEDSSMSTDNTWL